MSKKLRRHPEQKKPYPKQTPSKVAFTPSKFAFPARPQAPDCWPQAKLAPCLDLWDRGVSEVFSLCPSLLVTLFLLDTFFVSLLCLFLQSSPISTGFVVCMLRYVSPFFHLRYSSFPSSSSCCRSRCLLSSIVPCLCIPSSLISNFYPCLPCMNISVTVWHGMLYTTFLFFSPNGVFAYYASSFTLLVAFVAVRSELMLYRDFRDIYKTS